MREDKVETLMAINHLILDEVDRSVKILERMKDSPNRPL